MPSLAKRAGSSRSAERARAVPSRVRRGLVALSLLLVSLSSVAACGDGGDGAGGDGESAAIASDAPPSPASAPPSGSAAPSVASVAPPPAHPPLPEEELYPKKLSEQRDAMFRRMKVMLELDDAHLEALRALFDKTPYSGQGNPDLMEYAMTRKECRERRERAAVVDADEPLCGAPFMAPLWNPKAGETKDSAKVCIDRYEFPGIPCEHPVTWITARDAALACKAIGKRICDAHEWEGACAGAVLPPEQDYDFKKPRKESKHFHNAAREKVWAYGPKRSFDLCAMDSKKSKDCTQSGWKVCGSNSYPAGAFPECKSPFGVFDLHGNVAEHMNLPLKDKELGSRGGSGETEMKGSWFIFKKFDAHEDDCRWRAPDWHGTKLMAHDSHLNYHLGFRCCKDVGAAAPK